MLQWAWRMCWTLHPLHVEVFIGFGVWVSVIGYGFSSDRKLCQDHLNGYILGGVTAWKLCFNSPNYLNGAIFVHMPLFSWHQWARSWGRQLGLEEHKVWICCNSAPTHTHPITQSWPLHWVIQGYHWHYEASTKCHDLLYPHLAIVWH